MHSLRTLVRALNHHRSNADETPLSLSSHDHTTNPQMIVVVISLANNLMNTSDSPHPPPRQIDS